MKADFSYLSIEERDLLASGVRSEYYDPMIKFLTKEIDKMAKDVIMSNLEPSQEGVFRLAYLKAKIDGANHLLARFKTLKSHTRD